MGLQPGESAMYINGIAADLSVYDVYRLLETLRSEAKLMEGLHNMGIKVRNVKSFKVWESRYMYVKSF